MSADRKKGELATCAIEHPQRGVCTSCVLLARRKRKENPTNQHAPSAKELARASRCGRSRQWSCSCRRAGAPQNPAQPEPAKGCRPVGGRRLPREGRSRSILLPIKHYVVHFSSYEAFNELNLAVSHVSKRFTAKMLHRNALQ